VDNDISAAGGKRRPGFEALLDDIAGDRADTVVAWAWDRLSRNRRDTLRLIEVGQDAHTTIALVRGSDIDMSTASGRLVADLLAGVARAEIDTKGERQERAGLQRAEAGKPPARRAFGYLQDGTPHPTEGPVLANVFALFLAGSTQAGLARQLNADGFTSTRGKAFDDTTIRVLLTNPRYIGERWYRGERIGIGDWPPLVTPETFAAVQAVMTDPGRKKRRPARRYIGGGLFRCHCGAKAKISYDGTGARIYVCSARKHMARRAEPVEGLVYKVVAARLRRRPKGTPIVRPTGGTDITKIREKIVATHELIDGLAVDYSKQFLTGRQVQIATEQFEADLAMLEGQLADAGRGSALASIMKAPDLGQAWLDLPLDRQRAVLSDVVDVVILPGQPGRGKFDPATVDFRWVEDGGALVAGYGHAEPNTR
jgi:DNA invertase Pin-like site-specific DNA recombinase